MQNLLQLLSVLLVTVFVGVNSLRAAQEIKPQILFLRLQLHDGAVSLVSVTNVPGVLKTARGTNSSNALQLVVETAEGKPVWTEEIADPSVERLEYPDPGQPGTIQIKEVRRADVEFTVRVPAASGQRALAVYRRAAPARDATAKTSSSRVLLARIPLQNPAPQ